MFSDLGRQGIPFQVEGGNKNAANKNASTTKTVQNGANHDPESRLDFSFRKQAAIVRDIASMVRVPAAATML